MLMKTPIEEPEEPPHKPWEPGARTSVIVILMVAVAILIALLVNVAGTDGLNSMATEEGDLQLGP